MPLCDVLVLTGEVDPLLEAACIRTVRRGGHVVAHPRLELSRTSVRRIVERAIAVTRAHAGSGA